MKTITRQYKVYTFKELSKEAREKALDEHRYINVDHDFWYEDDFLLDCGLPKKLQRKDGNCVFTWKKIYFSIEYNYRHLQFTELHITEGYMDTFRQFLGISKRLWNKSYHRFTQEAGRYPNSILEFEPQDSMSDDFTDEECKIISQAEQKFADLVADGLKRLETNYEYLTNDIAIKETFEANEYRFLANGSIFV